MAAIFVKTFPGHSANSDSSKAYAMDFQRLLLTEFTTRIVFPKRHNKNNKINVFCLRCVNCVNLFWDGLNFVAHSSCGSCH